MSQTHSYRLKAAGAQFGTVAGAHKLSLSTSGNLRVTPREDPHRTEGYGEVWNSMFSSTESCAGVPEGLSPLRVAITRKPLEPELTSTA